MSKVQDIFGAAPKSVLNKPLMHVQDRKPAGVSGGVSIAGWQTRVLNNVLIQEITGASLSANEVTLPAGTYYIEGMTTGFLASGSHETAIQLRKSDDTVLMQGTGGANEGTSGTTAIPTLFGVITLNETTAVKVSCYRSGAWADGLGKASASGTDNVYTELRIWKLDSNIETPIISDPTMTLARPLLHVQDQKPSGTDGGSSVAGDQTRDLNAVLTNEISGASLAANMVTLPAGEYYIEGRAPVLTSNRHRLELKTDADAMLLVGQNAYGIASGGEVTQSQVSGRITLASTTTIKLNHYVETAKVTNGLGVQMLAAGADPYEVYSDLRIWQLDAVVKQPVIVNDKLYPLPGNTMVTGNMHGLEYEYTGVNSITVKPGICMDSLNETPLTLSTQQVVEIPAVQNAMYHLFLTDDNETVKTDLDIDGANLPVGDKRRWIGFVTTSSGSTDLRPFQVDGDKFLYEGDVTLHVGTGLIDPSNVAPPGRITGSIGVNSTSNGSLSYNNSVNFCTIESTRLATIPSLNNCYSMSAITLYLRHVTLKR